MPKVLVIKGSRLEWEMFDNHGWSTTKDLVEADLVQFTGGEDVTPGLYGEEKHPRTFYSPSRDIEEEKIFRAAKALGKPMAGICRGGQFLNVMCGGRMYQHVNHHAIRGTHAVVDVRKGRVIDCTSTHHQMMRAGETAALLGVASEATCCEYMDEDRIRYVEQQRGQDIEVLRYGNILCFQPHPEYLDADSECQKWYFELLEEIVNVA